MKHALWLVVTLLLAGCSDGGSGESDDEDAPPAEQERGQPGVDGNLTIDTTPYEVAAYITADGTLSMEPPTEGAIAFPHAMTDFVTGLEVIEILSEPFENAATIVGDVRLELWIDIQTVTTTQGVFDVAAWAGTTMTMPSFAFTTFSSPVMGPGEQVLIELDVAPGGSVDATLLTGDSVRYLIASAAPPGAGQMALLTGGDQPSMARFTVQNLTHDPSFGIAPATTTLTGTVYGGGFFFCGQVEGVDTHVQSFTVDDNATYLYITSTATGVGLTDLDIDLYDGSTHLSGGHTAGAEEGILVVGEALAPYRGATLDLRMTACIGGPVNYEILIAQA